MRNLKAEKLKSLNTFFPLKISTLLVYVTAL